MVLQFDSTQTFFLPVVDKLCSATKSLFHMAPGWRCKQYMVRQFSADGIWSRIQSKYAGLTSCCRYVGFDGYNKETGEEKGWSVARGAEIWWLGTCDRIKLGTKAWNKKTSLWLLRYVYIRNRSRLAIVYAVSAIWHGFFPGTCTTLVEATRSILKFLYPQNPAIL